MNPLGTRRDFFLFLLHQGRNLFTALHEMLTVAGILPLLLVTGLRFFLPVVCMYCTCTYHSFQTCHSSIHLSIHLEDDLGEPICTSYVYMYINFPSSLPCSLPCFSPLHQTRPDQIISSKSARSACTVLYIYDKVSTVLQYIATCIRAEGVA